MTGCKCKGEPTYSLSGFSWKLDMMIRELRNRCSYGELGLGDKTTQEIGGAVRRYQRSASRCDYKNGVKGVQAPRIKS